jgi:alpha-beta hydrolase superfamily lysophospholipase
MPTSAGRRVPPEVRSAGDVARPGPVAVTIDVSHVFGSRTGLTTAALVFAPARPPAGVPTVVFGFPGGGYSKSYFHLQVPGHPGYSMAEYMSDRGCYVVACDNLAAGESSRPHPASALSWQTLIDANQATVTAVLELLRRGGLVPGAGPLGPCRLIGFGHSLGAGLVTTQQVAYGTFDALVVLGRAIAGTHIPAPPADGGSEPSWRPGMEQRDEFAATSYLVDGYNFQPRRTAWQRYLFYWDDVPEAVIAADESAGTTFPVEAARGLAARNGPGAQAAAAVRVPILLGFGERDVVRDPRAEVAAYQSATDLQFVVLDHSGHCHNLSSSRYWLWDRVLGWAASLPR